MHRRRIQMAPFLKAVMEHDMLIIFPRPRADSFNGLPCMFSDPCFICFFATLTDGPGLCWKWQDNLLLCMDEAFFFSPLHAAANVSPLYLLTLRQGHSPAPVRERERKGKGRMKGESRGMESKGICNANGCPATLNNSKC